MKALDAVIVVLLIAVAWLLLGGSRGLLLYQQATATKIRCVVFFVLLAWALYDSAAIFRDWTGLPLFFRVCGFFGSLLLSLLFIGLIALAWDWLARRFRKT